VAEWFEEWFGEQYLALYPHRDDAEAARAVALILGAVPFRPGWRVLDVACGAGRHARAFEDAGARCTGIDLSATLLRVAQGITGAGLVRADMRHLPIRSGAMDLVVNLFTSFGYFDQDDEHAAALAGMVATLRPGGWFVIDYLNPAQVRAQLVARETVRAGDGELRISRALSPDGHQVRKTIEASDGRRWEERVRLFDPGEIHRMLAGAGVTVRKRFGDYSGGPLTSAAPRTILLGTAG
jgi:SAM-dependent methyltransferase